MRRYTFTGAQFARLSSSFAFSGKEAPSKVLQERHASGHLLKVRHVYLYFVLDEVRAPLIRYFDVGAFLDLLMVIHLLMKFAFK